MARGARKTPLEKLEIELTEVQENITHYENCLKTLRDNEKTLKDQLLIEQTKEICGLIETQGMSINDLKDLILLHSKNDQQSA